MKLFDQSGHHDYVRCLVPALVLGSIALSPVVGPVRVAVAVGGGAALLVGRRLSRPVRRRLPGPFSGRHVLQRLRFASESGVPVAECHLTRERL